MIINHNGCGLTTFTDAELEARLRTETGEFPIAPARFYSFTDAEANTLGILNRDLKATNLFVKKGRDGLHTVKVLDFGI